MQGQQVLDEAWAKVNPCVYGNDIGRHYEWVTWDDILGKKGEEMNISADFEGRIKRIGNQFLLQLGCKEFICQDLKAVGTKIVAVLSEEYKKIDGKE